MQAEIARHRAVVAPPSWEVLGRFFGVGKGLLWRIAHEGYDPRDPRIRRQLGLAVRLPADWASCECGNSFSPNVPWRQRCYECRPKKS